MNKVIKAPVEIIPHSIDWSYRIPSSETITSSNCTCMNIATLAATPNILVYATGVISGKTVTWRLTGGSALEDYKLVFTVTTSVGNVYTQGQLLEVRDELI